MEIWICTNTKKLSTHISIVCSVLIFEKLNEVYILEIKTNRNVAKNIYSSIFCYKYYRKLNIFLYFFILNFLFLCSEFLCFCVWMNGTTWTTKAKNSSLFHLTTSHAQKPKLRTNFYFSMNIMLLCLNESDATPHQAYFSISLLCISVFPKHISILYFCIFPKQNFFLYFSVWMNEMWRVVRCDKPPAWK